MKYCFRSRSKDTRAGYRVEGWALCCQCLPLKCLRSPDNYLSSPCQVLCQTKAATRPRPRPALGSNGGCGSGMAFGDVPEACMCTVLLGLQRLARVRPAQFTAALGLGLASDEAGGCVGRSGCEQGVLGGHPVWVHVAWWPRRCWAARVAGRRSTGILCGSSTGQLCARD